MAVAQDGLHFIVVGASVAGLATAIALRNSGHDVLVLEKQPQLGSPNSSNIVQGCARVPPNAYKILAEWGIESELRRHAALNDGFGVWKYYSEKGRDLMGINTWDPEMLVDARGDFMFLTHKALIQMLYDRATLPGDSEPVRVVFGAEVTKVDCDSDEPTVTLRSGEVHRADAVIGADGATGVVRAALMQVEGVGPEADEFTGLTVYSAIVPYELAKKERELDSFYEYPESTVCMGSRRGAATDLCGNRDIFFWAYTEDAPQDGSWTEPAHKKMSEILGPCDSGIRRLGELSGPASALQLKKYYELESWVSKSGRVMALGEAAHPLPVCGLHTYSLALEDGVFIGKIFSHSKDKARIPELLYAFEEHRKPRAAFIRNVDQSYVGLITLADGEAQEGRDAMMRANHAAGRNVFLSPGNMQAMLEETRTVFSYDAADDADEWWVSWGRYRDVSQSDPGPTAH
ncbi:hypothetical protein C8F01DRAFT_1150641 [Mycena amicta]|nr:hypothetical protein C8F01DRAFT_1150641 [Mycena amicta]